MIVAQIHAERELVCRGTVRLLGLSLIWYLPFTSPGTAAEGRSVIVEAEVPAVLQPWSLLGRDSETSAEVRDPEVLVGRPTC